MSTPHPSISIDLVLDRDHARDVLKGVLHAILFHRLFGNVRPKSIEVLDLAVPAVTDPEIEHLVENKISTFWKAVDVAADKRGQIITTFSEKKPRKSWFQVYMGEEDVPWEQWIVNAEVRQPKSERDRIEMLAALTSSVRDALLKMASYTSSDRGRVVVPLITNNTSISPFPMTIVVSVAGSEVGLT